MYNIFRSSLAVKFLTDLSIYLPLLQAKSLSVSVNDVSCFYFLDLKRWLSRSASNLGLNVTAKGFKT